MAEIANNSIDIQVVETGGENAQYFWHNTTDSGAGEGAGAHITEIPKADFIADPENGGGNTLVRSEGLYIRNGVDVLGSFTDTGAQIGQDSEARTFIDADSITLFTPENVPAFNVDIGENASEQTIQNGEVINTYLAYGESYTNTYSSLNDIANGTSFSIKLALSYGGANSVRVSADFVKGTSDSASGIFSRGEVTLTYTAPNTLSFTYLAGTWPDQKMNLMVVIISYTKIVRDTLIEMRGDLTIDSESVTWTNPDQVFVVETYDHAYSNISSGGVLNWNETVYKSGYYPIGCVSFNANRSGLYVDRAEVTNRAVGSCDIWLHARSGIAVSGNTAHMDILWVKAE